MSDYIIGNIVNSPVYMWIDSPPAAEIGSKSIYPFTLYLSGEGSEANNVQLYAQNSNSSPYQLPRNKWSHLIPQWRFVDTISYNNRQDEESHVITEIVPTVYAYVSSGGNTVGYLASAQFYYIDDMATDACDPVLIWATVNYLNNPVQSDFTIQENVSGFANSKVISVVPYNINNTEPDHLNITRNGIDEMFPLYWKNATVPFLVTVHGRYNFDCFTNTNYDYIYLFNVPVSGKSGDISKDMIDLSINARVPTTTWSPSGAVALSAIDNDGYDTGGFSKLAFTNSTTLTSAMLTAGVSIDYVPAQRHTDFIWLSNPENNTINRISTPCLPSSLALDIKQYLGQNIHLETSKDVTYLQVVSTAIMGLSGFHGIYGIAVDPCSNFWAADAESDKIYKFDISGQLLSSINFNTIGIDGGTPAGICLDENLDVWVTFFDSASVLKIDGTSGNILSSIYLGTEYSSIDPLLSPTTSADIIFKPILAETDKNSDIWVTLSNPISCALKKYNSITSNQIVSIDLPLSLVPMDLCISQDNGIWVALSDLPASSGEIRKYNTTGSLLSTISAIEPSYLTIDSSDNIWFIEDVNTVTKYSNGAYTHWTVGSAFSGWNSDIIGGDEVIVYPVLEGICSDSRDRIFIINSFENKLYIIQNDVLSFYSLISPNSKITWYNDTADFSTYSEVKPWVKSAQAFCDWSGNKWNLKYTTTYTGYSTSVYLTGQSIPFEIGDYSGLNIRKFNEDFNAIETFKSYVFSEHLLENNNLWDVLLGNTLGTNIPYVSGDNFDGGGKFGPAAYEKIANFVPNHADIDTCGVNQLYSLSQNVDVPIDDYNLNYPPELKRIMDIVSINQQVLWGDRCKCNLNIDNQFKSYVSGGDVFNPIGVDVLCSRCGHEHPANRGQLFDPINYMVTAYAPFIVMDRFFNNYFMLLNPSPSCSFTVGVCSDPCVGYSLQSTCLTTFPLSSYYNIVIPDYFNSASATESEFLNDVVKRYCFFEYLPSFCNQQIAGVINWDDPYTTLNQTTSSIEEWYGNGKNIEKIINYVLHRGLGLINE